MRIVDRYLLREYLLNVTYCFSAFFMIYIVYDLFSRIGKFLDAETPLKTVAFYYVCVMAPVLEYLIPASLLLAALYTLWQLTRNNEFTAMRASGISLFRVMMPFLGVGLVMTVFSAGVKEFAAPHASFWAESFSNNRYRGVDQAIYKDVAFFNSTTRRQWLIGRIEANQPDVLVSVTVKQERPNGSCFEQIEAKRAEWRDGRWWFHEARISRFDPEDNPIIRDGESRRFFEVATRPYSEEPRDLLNEVKPWEFLSSLEMARYLRTHLALSSSALAQKRYDLHHRLAMPWACLIVTLFGIPAGARGGRHSALTGILLALTFFFGYYTLSHVGVFLGKREILWPWLGAWLSNMVFLGAGAVLVARVR